MLFVYNEKKNKELYCYLCHMNWPSWLHMADNHRQMENGAKVTSNFENAGFSMTCESCKKPWIITFSCFKWITFSSSDCGLVK